MYLNKEKGNMLRKHYVRRNGKTGALSLEMMGIIAIIAVLVMSGLYYLNIMMRDTKINDAIAAMQLVNTKVNEMYINEGNFEGLEAEKFIATGNAPATIVTADKKNLRSPWGSIELKAASSEADGAENDVFSMTFNSVPRDVCQRLGAVVRNSTAWQRVTVGGATYDLANPEGNMVDWLFTNCGDGTQTVNLEFVSRRQ